MYHLLAGKGRTSVFVFLFSPPCIGTFQYQLLLARIRLALIAFLTAEATPDTRRVEIDARDDAIGPNVEPKYQTLGFSMLQNMLDHSIMTVKLDAPIVPIQAFLQAFPYPSYLKDDYVTGACSGWPEGIFQTRGFWVL
jgi:hypothetical protein